MLIEQHYSLQQHQGRCQVLQEAQRGVRQVPCGGVEAYQRHQRHRPGRHQPQRLAAGIERALGTHRRRVQQQPAEGQRYQHPGFHHQARQCRHRCLLADQPIEAEAQRQHQRHPGQAAHLPHLLGHTHGGHGHCQPLQAAQALAKNQHAQQHIDQRIDVVTQAGLEHAPVVHRPHVGQPVTGDQCPAQCQDAQPARVVAQFPPPAGVFPHQ
ncbi:hypothetical protein D9M73_172820 [compost metagenome]